jgi:transposase
MPVLYVGVDVAKDELVVAQWIEGRVVRLPTVANSAAGLEALAQRLDGRAERLVLALEPTAGYERALVAFGYARGWAMCVVNPNQFRDWVKSLGKRAKTDALDAAALARFASERQLAPWEPLPALVSQLDSLYTRKRQVEDLLLQERSRRDLLAAGPAPAPAVTASMEAVITLLEQTRAALDQAMQDLIDSDPPTQQRLRDLDSIPGVGAKTMLPLLVFLARWDTVTHGQGTAKGLTAYAGLDPQTNQSGKRRSKRSGISKMGDPEIRRLLFMAALGGKRGHNLLREFFEHLVGRGKQKMIALVAAARKILVWAWAVYRSGRPFDPTRAAAQLPA